VAHCSPKRRATAGEQSAQPLRIEPASVARPAGTRRSLWRGRRAPRRGRDRSAAARRDVFGVRQILHHQVGLADVLVGSVGGATGRFLGGVGAERRRPQDTQRESQRAALHRRAVRNALASWISGRSGSAFLASAATLSKYLRALPASPLALAAFAAP